MKAKLYKQTGELAGEIELSSDVFDLPMNKDLLHQTVIAFSANKRQILAHAKDRSEVRGGGRKPWKQKGTGRARHGSRRSPIWIGGGVTFGPTTDKNFSKKLNRKMKQKALFVALSAKVKDEAMFVLDSLELEERKTKKMVEVLNSLTQKLGRDINVNSLVVTAGKNDFVVAAGRNIPKIDITRAEDLNALDVLSKKNLVLTQDAVKKIEERVLKNNLEKQEK